MPRHPKHCPSRCPVGLRVVLERCWGLFGALGGSGQPSNMSQTPKIAEDGLHDGPILPKMFPKTAQEGIHGFPGCLRSPQAASKKAPDAPRGPWTHPKGVLEERRARKNQEKERACCRSFNVFCLPPLSAQHGSMRGPGRTLAQDNPKTAPRWRKNVSQRASKATHYGPKTLPDGPGGAKDGSRGPQ